MKMCDPEHIFPLRIVLGQCFAEIFSSKCSSLGSAALQLLSAPRGGLKQYELLRVTQLLSLFFSSSCPTCTADSTQASIQRTLAGSYPWRGNRRGNVK